MHFTWCFILYFVSAIQGQNYRNDHNEIPGTNCHSRIGVSQPGRTDPVYWLYASDGWASKARLYNEEAWISELPIYVDDRQPYYAWIQVFCLFLSRFCVIKKPSCFVIYVKTQKFNADNLNADCHRP